MNTPDATTNAPSASESLEAWVSVATVAARLGVSERAIQKRCADGKMNARQVTTPQGRRWEINAREPDTKRTNERNEPPHEAANERNERHSFDAQNHANARSERTEAANERSSEREAQLRDDLASERENAAFLRGVIEQLQQSEAQTKAALREALKAMPKQLEAGQQPATTERAEAPQNAPMDLASHAPTNPGEIEADGEEADELRALCFRVCAR